jgi:hypothetical protein
VLSWAFVFGNEHPLICGLEKVHSVHLKQKQDSSFEVGALDKGLA